MMDQDIKVKWLEALRSGNYTQTESRLHDNLGYCCLGVLCDVAGADWHPMGIDAYVPIMLDGEPAVADGEELSTYGREKFGISYEATNVLMGMNDGTGDFEKRTFKQIADYIEAKL